jgi:hypothetical protein
VEQAQASPENRRKQADRVTASSSAADVYERARELTEAAIDALTAALSEPGERVQAAIALLSVGWGAPVQPVVFDTSHITIECHDGHPPARASNGEDPTDRRHVGKPMV